MKLKNTQSIGLVFNLTKPHEYETYHAILNYAHENGLQPATCVKMLLKQHLQGGTLLTNSKPKKTDTGGFDDAFEIGY